MTSLAPGLIRMNYHGQRGITAAKAAALRAGDHHVYPGAA